MAQATASVPVTIVADQTAPVHLTMGSTIANLSVSPSPLRRGVGERTGLIVTPKSAAGLVEPWDIVFR